MGAGNHLRWEEHAQLRAMMNAVVSGIKQCAQPNGFIMGFNESELVTDEHPDYTLSWTTHGLLAAHAAGNPDALPLARGMISLMNNHTLLPLFLPPDGGDPPFDTPAVFPPPFPQWDNVTNQGESPPHGHAIYLIYQGLIHQTQMALSEAGTQADVDLVAQLYEESWWLEQLAAGDPGAIWHRQWWSTYITEHFPSSHPLVKLTLAPIPHRPQLRADGDRGVASTAPTYGDPAATHSPLTLLALPLVVQPRHVRAHGGSIVPRCRHGCVAHVARILPAPRGKRGDQ